VLFADLVGFTEQSEALDVEDVDAFLAPYHGMLRRVVERTGGIVSDFAGDGMMAVFGAPVAHEDDPERAVRAAVEIRDLVASTASEATTPGLHVRLGITTGEVLITLGPAGGVDATGDVVNTAARLEAAAPTDGVLVDEYTWRACGRAILFEQVQPVMAKGKAVPVAAWRAVAARSAVPEQSREYVSLVGRRSESAILCEVLERVCRERSTQLVSLIGEPGIGKTRLVEELHASLRRFPDPVIWRRGRSLAYGQGIALWGLGEIVKQEAGILDSDDAETAQRKLAETVARVVPDEEGRPWVLRHLRPLIGVSAEVGLGAESRLESFSAWRHFLEAIAERAPCALVFEDIHWADDVLIDFIDHLADRASGVPILILCTTRPELFERRPSWAGGKTNAHTISLQPLSDSEIGTLIERLLSTASVSDELRSKVTESIAGNPLYAQEFVRMLQDREALVSDAGSWTLRAGELGIPESIQGVIAARLDTLTPAEKSFIVDASVIGRTAWIGALCSLADRTPSQADEALHNLERKQLLRRVRHSSIHGETEFQFGHALTRDVAYAQIRRADRATKHERAAAWIDDVAGQREDKAELLASHYTQALELRQLLGDLSVDLRPKALTALIEAGRQAAQSSAHAAAARHYQGALGLVPEEDQTLRAGILRGIATAAINQSIVDRAVLREAVGAQVAIEDWEAAAELEWRSAYWYEQHAGSGDEAREHLDRAADYAAQGRLTTTACLIAAQQARRLNNAGHASAVLELTERLIPEAERARLAAGHAILIGWRGLARFELGDESGLDDIRNAATTLAAQAHERTGPVYINLGNTLRGHGDMPAARDAFDEAARWADRFASPLLIDWAAGERAYQAYHAGEWTKAEQLLSRSWQSGAFTENGARLVAGRIALGRGQIELALGNARPVIQYSATTGDDQSLYYGQALAARSHLAAGRKTDAAASCEQITARWTESAGLAACAIELCETVYVLASAGRSQEIRRAGAILPTTCRWREAILLTSDEDYAGAAALYGEMGSAPLAADANLLAAAKAASERRLADARRHCDAVLAFAEQSGATLYRREAESLSR
jgi:class 3 adenylate cyclase